MVLLAVSNSKIEELKDLRADYMARMTEADKWAAVRRLRGRTVKILLWSLGTTALGLIMHFTLAGHLPSNFKPKYWGWGVATAASIAAWGCLVVLCLPKARLVKEAATKAVTKNRSDLAEAYGQQQRQWGCIFDPVLALYVFATYQLLF